MRAGSRAAAAALLLLAALAGAPAPAQELRPEAGLMWQRSGLPAVFPLQLKTPEGADYFLTLTREAGGEAVLAAYVRGGDFFRVLVPPGRYRLRLASGRDWQGEAQLFGAGTQDFVLPGVLEFAVQGGGIKAGHTVSLTRDGPQGGWQAAVVGQYICQVAGLDQRRAEPQRDTGNFDSAGFRLRGGSGARQGLHWRWRPGALTGAAPPVQRPPLQDQSLLDIPEPLDWLGLPPAAQAGAPAQLRRRPGYRVRSLVCG